MDKDELMKMKCWFCWWREGGHCFILGHTHRVKITLGMDKHCDAFKSKRTVLASIIPNDRLVIQSEINKYKKLIGR